MSKFAKKKSTKLVNYDKCPTVPLFAFANNIAKDNYIEDESINSVYIVDDNEGKIVFRGNSLYITTQFMMDCIQTYYAINLERNQYDSIEPLNYTFENKNTNDLYEHRNHSQHRNSYGYRRNGSVPTTNKAIQALDILFYMKERGKTCISSSSTANFNRIDRYSEGIVSRSESNPPFKMEVYTSHLISERLEFTRMMNEMLSMHGSNIRKCNSVRECKNTLELLDKHNTKTIGNTKVSKLENLFLELGGQAYVS